MSSQTPTWAAVRSAWTADWKATYKDAVRAYTARILAAPANYKPTVEAFLKLVGGNGAQLQASRKKLLVLKAAAKEETALVSDFSKRAKDWTALERENQHLSAGLLADAVDASEPTTGAIPVLVVAGIAVTVGGIAWAVVAMEVATGHRERIALFNKELDARVAALNLGQTLPASTIGPMEPPKKEGGGWMLPALVGLGVTAASGLIIYKFTS
ncbi:MAG: hypothetical protein ACI8RZ_001474 [Myxococcota bacterium]|jgi:hypothetical protein